MKITINAENQVLGRLATYAAKQALLGNTIVVINSEKPEKKQYFIIIRWRFAC